jgi:hypothetical protein
MDFTVLPDLTDFIIGFVLIAAVGVVAVLATLVTFVVENRALRVRRHEGLFSYYGHLTLGR